MTLILSLPGLIASGGSNEAAVAMFVWSALAIVAGSRAPSIPRMTIRRLQLTM